MAFYINKYVFQYVFDAFSKLLMNMWYVKYHG